MYPLTQQEHMPTTISSRAFPDMTNRKPIFSRLIAFFRWVIAYIQSIYTRYTSSIITSDSGRKVRIGRQIAEGGFSFVFECFDVDTNEKYVVKRIQCADPEVLRSCRKEAGTHRAVSHPNLMPLLGIAVVDHTCYMIFPYFPYSLREEVNRRCFTEEVRRPWKEVEVLELFYDILQGVHALHDANLSHRDIKLENILLKGPRSRQPVLMDFGSAGPLSASLNNRNAVLTIVEEASMHTTLSYRPPELFEGGMRQGDSPLDFTKVDVWSLGCTLFAMLYGASPFECEFNRSNGRVKIVDCTQLKVLGGMTWPPAATEPANWYRNDIKTLIESMLHQDRMQRTTLEQTLQRTESIIHNLGGKVSNTTGKMPHHDDDETDGIGIALMSDRNYV